MADEVSRVGTRVLISAFLPADPSRNYDSMGYRSLLGTKKVSVHLLALSVAVLELIVRANYT